MKYGKELYYINSSHLFAQKYKFQPGVPVDERKKVMNCGRRLQWKGYLTHVGHYGMLRGNELVYFRIRLKKNVYYRIMFVGQDGITDVQMGLYNHNYRKLAGSVRYSSWGSGVFAVHYRPYTTLKFFVRIKNMSNAGRALRYYIIVAMK